MNWTAPIVMLLAAASCAPPADGTGSDPTPIGTDGTTTVVVTGTTPTPTTDPTPTVTGSTTTAPYAPPSLLEVVCTANANVLRGDCVVTVDPPQPVQISFVRSDGVGPTRVHASEAVSGTHDIPLYFMGPAREYALTVTAVTWPSEPIVTSTFTTGQPPFDVGSWLKNIEGVSTLPMIGTELPCDGAAIAVIYDTTTGDLVWYQNIDPGGSLGVLDMVRFTPEKTIAGETGEFVSEVDLLGNQLTAFPAEDLGGCCGPHHDMFKWNDQFYLLHQYYPDFGLTLDALVIYDSVGNELAHWYPDQYLDIPGSASGDYFHTNTVFVDDNGDILLNYLTQETFIKIVGDVNSPDFGQPIWILDAGTNGGLGSDFAVDWSLVGGANSLNFQHNLNVGPDGRLYVLDDGNDRGLRFALDEVNMTATVDAEWPTADSCGVQGTTQATSIGNALVACDTEMVREFDGVTSELLWEAEVDCRNGGDDGFFGGISPTRWYPIEGW